MNTQYNNVIINKLNLSKRTKKILLKISDDLLDLTNEDLLNTYKLGTKSLNELTEELKKINLNLKTVS